MVGVLEYKLHDLDSTPPLNGVLDYKLHYLESIPPVNGVLECKLHDLDSRGEGCSLSRGVP